MSSASVALYIYGDDLDPAHVTDQIGVRPDLARRKGEQRSLGDGRIVTQKTGVWRRYMDTNAGAISASVSELIAEFDGRKDRLDAIPGVEVVNVDIFCAMSSTEIDEGDLKFDLPQAVLERISALGASLSVTLGVVK